jgi:hypothetical protein
MLRHEFRHDLQRVNALTKDARTGHGWVRHSPRIPVDPSAVPADLGLDPWAGEVAPDWRGAGGLPKARDQSAG